MGPATTADSRHESPRRRVWRVARVVLVVTTAILLAGELVGIDIVGWAQDVGDRVTKVDPL